MKADLTRFQALKMSQADKSRVQDWLDLLRTTETGIMGGGSTPSSCSADAATAIGATADAVKAASPGGAISGGAFAGGEFRRWQQQLGDVTSRWAAT